MRMLDLLHRWTGGLIGLVLAVLGLSGTILLHKEAWIGVPGAGDPVDRDALAATAVRLVEAEQPRSILFASESFGLHRLGFAEGAGAYARQDGTVVARWDTIWERPELWLFDLHHHLLAGDTGETVAGVAALAGLFFAISGAILWWRTRRTFRFRLLPRRLTVASIRMHHRDLGIVMLPLLVLSFVTGAMLVFRPVAHLVTAPFGKPAAIEAMLAPPAVQGGSLDRKLDIAALLAEGAARFPGAEPRYLGFPSAPGKLVTLRMKQAAEWLPNGRSTLWFDAADGRLIEARDARAQGGAAQAFNTTYPLHAAKVGGLAYRLVMTASGLALTLLGSLAVWSFWLGRSRQAVRAVPLPAE